MFTTCNATCFIRDTVICILLALMSIIHTKDFSEVTRCLHNRHGEQMRCSHENYSIGSTKNKIFSEILQRPALSTVWSSLPLFDPGEIEIVLNDFNGKTILGSGSEGVVYLVKLRHRKNGLCVVKFIENAVSMRQIENELTVLLKLNDSGCTPSIYGYTTREKLNGETEFGIVMSLIYVSPGHSMSLSKFIDEGPRIDTISWLELCLKMAKCLVELHQRDVIHGDLKIHNVLIEQTQDGEWRTYWIDFGHAVKSTNSHGYPITEEYRSRFRNVHLHLAPEIFDGENLSKASDVYAFGKLLEDIMTFSDIADLQIIVTLTTNSDCKQRPDAGDVVNHLNELITFLGDEDLD